VEDRLREAICSFAYLMAQLHISEHGPNRGEVVDVIQKHAGGSVGWAWCVAFADFVVDMAHRWLMVPAPFDVGISSSRLVHEARTHGRLITDPMQVQRGDLMVLKGGPTGFKHTGIVLQVFEDGGAVTLKTVEGNTNDAGSAEGDGVYTKTRPADPGRMVWINVARR
jgi:hypothetical protein